MGIPISSKLRLHDDVIKWKHFPRYWPFVRGIHRSQVNSPHKGQWRGALMFSLICAQINGWVNNCEAGDLRYRRAHYDVTVMNNFVSHIPEVTMIYMAHDFSITIQNSIPNILIATYFCAWHDSYAVAACANNCCGLMTANGITAKQYFHRIWIVSENTLVTWAPKPQFRQFNVLTTNVFITIYTNFLSWELH